MTALDEVDHGTHFIANGCPRRDHCSKPTPLILYIFALKVIFKLEAHRLGSRCNFYGGSPLVLVLVVFILGQRALSLENVC